MLAESQTLLARREQAGPGVAKALGITAGRRGHPLEAAAARRQRCRCASRTPTSTRCCCPGFLQAAMPTSLFDALAARGLRPTWAEDSITADRANAEEATLLQVKEGDPVLLVGPSRAGGREARRGLPVGLPRRPLHAVGPARPGELSRPSSATARPALLADPHRVRAAQVGLDVERVLRGVRPAARGRPASGPTSRRGRPARPGRPARRRTPRPPATARPTTAAAPARPRAPRPRARWRAGAPGGRPGPRHAPRGTPSRPPIHPATRGPSLTPMSGRTCSRWRSSHAQDVPGRAGGRRRPAGAGRAGGDREPLARPRRGLGRAAGHRAAGAGHAAAQRLLHAPPAASSPAWSGWPRSTSGCGAEGVVFGFLDADLEVDVETCEALARALPGVPWTFHRAVDADPRPAPRSWRRLVTLPGLTAVRSGGSPQGLSHGYDDLLALASADPRRGPPADARRRPAWPSTCRGSSGPASPSSTSGPRSGPGSPSSPTSTPTFVRSWRRLLDSRGGAGDPDRPAEVPAHGRLWSHLASDTSYDELHAFAARARHPRAGLRARPLRRAGRVLRPARRGRRRAGVLARAGRRCAPAAPRKRLAA